MRLLAAAGIEVTALGDSLTVTAPSWRGDLVDPYDVVEEVGRHVGYDAIGLSLPVPKETRGLDPAIRDRRAVLRAVAQLGFSEVLTLPFASAEELDQLGLAADDPRRALVRLANPLSETHGYLRTTLLPGLFAAAARNTSRSIDDLAIFECGSAFLANDKGAAPQPDVARRPSDDEIAQVTGSLPDQPRLLAGVLTGNWVPAGWQGPAIKADWRHAVLLAEEAAHAVGLQLTRRAAQRTPWHPGRCAELLIGDQVIGYAGELHPSVVQAFGLPERACAVEFDLDKLIAAAPRGGEVSAISPYPLLKEDVALIVTADMPAAQVRDALVDGAGELLETIRLFDIYTGPQAGEGKKSLAFALGFRAPDRTLTEAEAAAARDAAVAMAAERCGAVQRA